MIPIQSVAALLNPLHGYHLAVWLNAVLVLAVWLNVLLNSYVLHGLILDALDDFLLFDDFVLPRHLVLETVFLALPRLI